MDKETFLDSFLEDSSNLSNMKKERHGFLTFWLIFGIVMNAIVALVFGAFILALKSEGSKVINLGYLSFVLYFTGCICNILLLNWKISGFYIYCIVAMISCMIEPKAYIIITGIFGPLLNFTFFQLKENDISAWTHLTSKYSNLDNTMDFNKNIFSEYNSDIDENQNEYKKCPFCAENIKKDAIVCRFCQRTLSSKERSKTIEFNLLYFMIGFLVSLLCRLLVRLTIGQH